MHIGSGWLQHTLGSDFSRAPPFAAGTTDVLAPPAIHLSHDARQNWVAFYNAAERDLAESGELRPIRPFGAKMAEHAGRLAAVLATYADPDTMEVDGNTMACGIALVQHYAAETLRLHNAGSVPPDLHLAAKLYLVAGAQSNPCCHLAAIYQRGPGAVRDAAAARPVSVSWRTRLDHTPPGRHGG